MDNFSERLMSRATSFDELLGEDFEFAAGEKADTDLAARRLAAWCRSSASGDWTQFARRLQRDGLSFEAILSRFSYSRRSSAAGVPQWVSDAIWIEAAMRGSAARESGGLANRGAGVQPFEDLFIPVVQEADRLLWSGLTCGAIDQSGRDCLPAMLLRELCTLSAPALYEAFSAARKLSADAAQGAAAGRSRYDRFIGEMREGGIRRLFEDKPVLLRLLAVLTRQWIETSRLFLLRLDADAGRIRREILDAAPGVPVTLIEGEQSDRHNGGQSVLIVTFADGGRVVYKPKDLRVDVAWHAMVERLNASSPPVDLKAPQAIAQDGYGWTEFIEHTGCESADGFAGFFRRAGAWLALLHRFVAADMHQENLIAAGAHPVPIDLETIFHAGIVEGPNEDTSAREAARSLLVNSIMMVGLLPAYGRSAFNRVFAMGGLTSGWTERTQIAWSNINSDAMRPTKIQEGGSTNPNLPHIDGHYARLVDHIDDFANGFETYASFLSARPEHGLALLAPFAGAPVRKVVRPTRFYYMLQQRLRNHKSMDDGVLWSVQADFVTRLSTGRRGTDALWPLLRRERAVLLNLNVPHFVSPSDRSEICDDTGLVLTTDDLSGIARARARFETYDSNEIAWQAEIIRENTPHGPVRSPVVSPPIADGAPESVDSKTCADRALAEAGRIAEELQRYAIRRGQTAAWIGLDWLEDAEAFQLACLGPDLYNGATGIAVFLAAHAAVSGSACSRDLAIAAVHELRGDLRQPTSARVARTMGIGGASGLGSVIYALTVLSDLTSDLSLRDDALSAAALINADVIKADSRLDVIGGSAGAILCLLRLYRDTRAEDVLRTAIACGEHLLRQERFGEAGRRSWPIQGAGPRALNGFSHGAAGFAYALASLAAASGRSEFADAAAECVAYENDSYDARRKNWPDFRGRAEPGWVAQWCHGAPGIGLARLAMMRLDSGNATQLAHDAANAIECAEVTWPGAVDTLCCGTFGSIEFLRHAGKVLHRKDLAEFATRSFQAVLAAASANGDYRWSSGKRQFNLGLFRGLAGVGYACLRQVDPALPNLLIWE